MSRANPRTTHGNAGIAAWNFKMHAQVRSYADAERAMELLGEGGFAPIGPNMTLIYEGHDLDPDQGARTYAVELYGTKILRYYPDGTFSVDNGGFATPTTRERLAAVVPEGFIPYHHEKKLGLRRFTREPYSDSGDGKKGIWPLDHGIRIIAAGTVEDGQEIPRGVEYPYIDLSHSMTTADLEMSVHGRLEYLRGELRAERISMGELIELQGLAEHIDPGDVELLEAAGVPEHSEGD